MRKTWRTLPFTILATSFVLLLMACGAANSAQPSNSDLASLAITLTGPSTVMLGAQSQYAAIVTGGSDARVTWSVNGVAGGNNTVGSISDKGLYTAPQSAPQSSSVTITAASAASPSVSKSLPVALTSPPASQDGGTSSVALTIAGPSNVTLGTSAPYVATVTGSGNTSVSWSVNGVTGGNTAVGVISASGLYTAPATAPQGGRVTITATSVADSSISENMTVTLTAPQAPGGNGAGSSVTLELSGATTVTLGTMTRYTAIISGSGNTGVTWSVNGVTGGNSTIGTISTKGLYTAPAKQPGSTKVTITAASAADRSVSRSLVVSLIAPSQPPSGPSVNLAVSGATTVTLGTMTRYTATVSGSSNTGVTWSVNGVTGGNSTLGTISAKGLYSAPTKPPTGSKVTITATSAADHSVSSSLVVSLVALASGGTGGGPSVTLALSGATTVMLSKTAQYTATVTGDSDTAVTWSINGVIGGDAALGTISSGGLYSAPAKAPQSSKVTVTATSKADPSVSQNLVVTLVAQPTPPVTVTLTLSGPASVQLGNTSQYTATVTGSSNTGVTWSVDGLAGGDSSVGTISSTGRYTAPTKAPSSSKVTISANSMADTSVSQSMTITLFAPPPTVALTLTGATTVPLGTSSQYTATVTGTNNTGVVWTVNGQTGGNMTDGTISAAGLYSAPSTAPQPSTITITATSAADSTVAKSIVVTLIAPVGGSRIPANAIKSADLNASSKWAWNHDPGTPGTSNGTTTYPVAGLSADDAAREFSMTFTSGGGEIYHVSFAKDTTATHFVYDANVYVVNPSQLKNLEMDMNAVMANGQTVILATQCSGYSKTWEYTLRSGTGYHWNPSNIPCDPMQWTAKTWHHIQIATHRDSSGNAYYDWIGFDGKYTDFQNAGGANGRNLGWAIGTLLINFQIDGPSKTNGSNILYTDQLFVWRW
jgi:hypothetical protein